VKGTIVRTFIDQGGDGSMTVKLDLTHRRKGLLWFPTYTVDFDGRFTFANPTPCPSNSLSV
jgi:hypothetical protein